MAIIKSGPFLIALLLFSLSIYHPAVLAKSEDPTQYWDIRSIDTMKYSRDTAAAKLGDENFNQEIGTQIRNIKSTGANYVAIDTPYDERFLPFLRRWVFEARANNIHIWFRGNFSAWEGWFGVRRRMSNQEHTRQAVQFIKDHSDLFEDGDIFSSCPECENGSIGDPRQTGKVNDYRQFMISETQATTQAFADINIKVATNYWSMNLDVAKLIMDQDTAQKLGRVVVVDHYVQSPQKLIQDVDTLARQSNANVILGEFGAPIPDLNGKMTDLEQADWLKQLLNLGSKSNSLIGLNYWVSKGGSTAIWDDENNPKIAVETLTRYYNPTLTVGHIQDEFGNPIGEANVSSAERMTTTQNGNFKIVNDGTQLIVKKDGYQELTLTASSSTLSASPSALEITLIKKDKNLIDLVRLWVWRHVKIAFI